MATYHTQTVRPGFQGLAVIGSQNIRCSSFGVNPNQETLFYKHVIGLNDTIPTDTATKGEAVGIIQAQQVMWRPSPLSISGGFSYPACYTSATSGNISDLFGYAKYGNIFNIDYSFYCNKKRTFTGCRVNTWTLSASAGDIVQITADVLAKSITESSSSTSYTTMEKFLTWDKIGITVAGFTNPKILAFDLTINNNAQNIYVSSSTTSGFVANRPFDIRLGTQEVSGTITFYLKQPEIELTASSAVSVITLTLPGQTITIQAVLRNEQVEGKVGPIVTAIPFVGVDKALGN